MGWPGELAGGRPTRELEVHLCSLRGSGVVLSEATCSFETRSQYSRGASRILTFPPTRTLLGPLPEAHSPYNQVREKSPSRHQRLISHTVPSVCTLGLRERFARVRGLSRLFVGQLFERRVVVSSGMLQTPGIKSNAPRELEIRVSDSPSTASNRG